MSKRKRKGAARGAARRRKNRTTLAIVKILIVLIALFCIAMYTPVLQLRQVLVVGTSVVDPQAVLTTANIPEKINILKIDRKTVIENLEKIPYVSKAEIKYSFPNNIKIVISEGSPYYSFESGEEYVNTDENLKIIEITQTPKILPVFEGLTFEKKSPGEIITIDESEKIDIILLYYNILKEKNMLDKVESIQIEEYTVNLKLVSGVKVKCGNRQDAGRKIAALEASIAQSEAEGISLKIGTFDITDPKQVVYSAD